MSSEGTSGNLTERTSGAFDRLNTLYYSVERRVRSVSPYVVRVIEVVLAVGLLAALAHWLYWVYVLGV